MIVIDTNIFSALMSADHGIDDWLTTISPSDLYTTSVTRAEIRYGIARLPHGRRRDDIEGRADALFAEIDDRTLTFSSRAADAYGDIVATREHDGRPIGVLDAQIAAIARIHRAAVATRNVTDFEGCGVDVVNPYTAAGDH
ncbi:type II toxin-antitoxin system VapC family toxin [Humibacter sp. RRB41]|uniref:type II toxin-antitoxin system VapC family toxin n=1 Tax=Humibacter sp. RRB41 TaxID=2919946 RepID=UPI001FA9B088|nr:type II toxin-antitoxin system VapC family toxin [Humibacter sp. RRB41]